METAFIVLNSECTKECHYCFYNTGHLEKKEELLSVESVMSFCSALKAKGLRGVILTGGEPLLFKELTSLIERLVKSDIYTLLISNGDLLTNEKINKLQKSGLSSITLSLHIENDNENEFEKKMKKLSSKISFPLTLIFRLTSRNYTLAGKASEIAKNLGKGLILQPAFIPAYSKQYQSLSLKNLFINKKESTDKFRADITRWAESFNSLEYAGLFLSLFTEKPEKPHFCPMGTGIAVLNCDGEVIPCFHRGDLPIGNIFKDEIASIVSKIGEHSQTLCNADCFGEHCVSLFA